MQIEKDLIAGAILAGYAAVETLRRVGLIHFGRKEKTNGTNGCDNIDCHDIVMASKNKIRSLEDCQVKIFERLDNMPQRIVAMLRDTKGLF